MMLMSQVMRVLSRRVNGCIRDGFRMRITFGSRTNPSAAFPFAGRYAILGHLIYHAD